MKTPTAAYYDSMSTDKPGTEMPGDPRPYTSEAIRARRRAIQAGRLKAPAPDEVARAVDAAEAAVAAEEREVVEAKERDEAEAKVAAEKAEAATEGTAETT